MSLYMNFETNKDDEQRYYVEKPLSTLCRGKDAQILDDASMEAHQGSVTETLSTIEQVKEVNRGENIEEKKEKINEENTSSLEETEFIIKEPDTDCKSISDNISFRDCGEPMTTQYLQLDFTPVPNGDDNKFNINKCVEFWKFIDKHPELNSLKVEADVLDYDDSESLFSLSTACTTTSTQSESEEIGLSPITKQALNWFKKEDVMTDSLATKQFCIHPCEPVSKDEVEYCPKNEKEDWPKYEYKRPGTSLVQKSQTNLATKTQPVNDLAQMMAEMHKWDLQHPKSMEPPEHATSLTSTKTDRNRSLVTYIATDDDKYCEKCLH